MPTADIGDGFLMREGYTIVAVGWQFDVPADEIGLDPPVATDNGKAILGSISTWFIPNQAGTSVNSRERASMRRWIPPARATVSPQREGYYGTPTPIPRENWRIRTPGGREDDGRLAIGVL